MKVAISQPNYLPWIGYFQLISSVDTFVFLDDVQYTPRDWRNRNLIKTKNGLEWISIGVSLPIGRSSLINKVEINDSNWANRHLSSIRHSYRQSREFTKYFPIVEDWLQSKMHEKYLCKLNIEITMEIANLLGINTKFLIASEISMPNDKNLRLLEICQILNANTYVSGPAAKTYLKVEEFNAKNITVEFFPYKSKEYEQLFGKFEPGVTVIDAILNLGEKAGNLL